MTWFSGWTTPPPPNTPAPAPTIPPAGLDPEETAEEREDSRLSKAWKPDLKLRMKNRSNEFIDRYIIEKVLEEDNGSELKWLYELLEDGVRVLNDTGRYIKSEPFLARIRKLRKEHV